MTSSPRILFTGATGFIGGTILAHLLNSTSSSLSQATITCLIRGPEDRAAKLSSTYGPRVTPLVYKDLDDLDATTDIAAQHDIVISNTLGYHLPSAQALLRGLARRKAATGQEVWMIHLSGASNLADRRISGAYVEPDPEREFDDVKDDIYTYEKEREALQSYIQRHTELGVIDTGLELGVKTLVMMPPLIYGVGTGLFNNISIQIPANIRTTLEQGHAIVIDGGKGVLDHVHVEDLAALYEIMVREILENGGKRLPTGKQGIIFSGNGRHSWMEAAQGIADACYEEGQIKERRVASVGLAEGAKILASYLSDEGEREALVEVGLAGTVRTVPSVARRLGWIPTRREEQFRQGIRDDVKIVLAKRSA